MKKIKITQKMVDFVESHKDYSKIIHYDKDFHINVGDDAAITGFSRDRRSLEVATAEGMYFYMPAVVFDFDVDEWAHQRQVESILRKKQIDNAEALAKVDWIAERNHIALEILKEIVRKEYTLYSSSNEAVVGAAVDMANKMVNMMRGMNSTDKKVANKE